ncbi:MAG: carbohydrate ABC transporter permease, partial [Clostridia bacterium]
MNKLGKSRWVSTIFLTLLGLTCVLPILLVLSISLTEEEAIIKNGYSLIPSQWSLDAYRTIFAGGQQLVKSYGVSVFVTVMGTMGAVIITGMAGYALANPSVRYRYQLSMFFFITM